ncbi:type I polyketide synthase, partial [Serratia ficaria]|uniref:type I polyketide synthase n=1 Tax=Serratia ficaria TaxID=61651 RepID=UPI0021C75D61
AALKQAGVRPADVGYVECHGTGTRLGDPIEVQALGAVLAEGRDAAQPVILGSVKSNIGHTQAAAGVAGLIKTVLALQHGIIPQNLHFATPNPHIPWDQLPVRVAAEATPWPPGDRPRIAGVSAFGWSGTNAHVILEEAPRAADPAGREAPMRKVQLLVLSGRTDAAARGAAQRLAAHLRAHPEVALQDTAWSLATTRSHHEHRLALVADGREAAAGLLEQLACGEQPGGTRGGVSTVATRAWLFTGQGSQRCGMGQELWAQWPAFRQGFDAACEALDRELGGDLKAVMWGDDERQLAETGWTQPALFALQAGLAALWRSWGIQPDYVAGHSLGELSAAYAAGVFTLEEAARLVAARGRLMQALPSGGSMAALNLPETEVRRLTAGLTVSLAAVNGPSSVVISGEAGVVREAADRCVAAGGRATELAVSHAFHSGLMAPMLAAFRDVAEGVNYQRPSVAVVSNVSGKLADDALCTAEYWVEHVMETVRFADGIATLAENGVNEFIELGPQGTLLGMAAECLEDGAAAVQLVASLQRKRGETQAVLEGLGALHVRGAALSWPGVFSGGERRVALPLYAWQRERYWSAARNAVTEMTAGTTYPEECVADTATHTGWDAGSESEQRQALLRLIGAEAARILSLRSAEEIDSRQPLSERGMDSLMALELRRALAKKTGLTLPATLAYDYPSPQAIASFILQDKSDEKNSVPSSAEIDASEPIAIVGIGCRYPGGIRNTNDFWQLMADGADVITEVPEERWDINALYDPDPAASGKITSRSGGFLDDIDQFDASFFGISPREALNLDPQQRLLLETSWEALEDAGIPPHKIVESHTGVFFGLMPSEYAANTSVENFNGYIKTGTSPSIATGRLSYILGLKGPAITVDTACSSSLVSIHLACQSLRSHETSMALAGGATLNITPSMYLEFSRLRGLASDGRCKTFSDAADGTGWSEGSGVVVLKRMSDALRDGDRIWAVLRGTAVNQDGRSNGLTAPNGPAQEAVVRAALKQAGVRPADVGYVECHGTGTRLGDPIEVQA